MSPETENTNPADDKATLVEQLVAYLDGELDDRASRRIEEMLASDPEAQRKLDQLEGAWALLDTLEPAQLGDLFTQSTLEMVTTAAAEDVERNKAEAPRRRRRRWWIGSSGMLAAAAAGALCIALFLPNRNEQLLRDYPVLENLDQLRLIDNVKFLELMLDNEDELFGEEADDGP
ncbi:MAG: anti-sigma factor family protein [Planctomycetota bacterium]|jgi:ferric-dicitrate binding protein FerR (iron transport regulator)